MDHLTTDEFPSPLEQPLDIPPTRLVSLVPALTEALYDLDLGDRLIGISAHCTRPLERLATLPRLGTPAQPDLSQIIALEPELVLLDADRTPRTAAAALAAAGIRLWITGPRTVFDALNLLWQLMEVCDHAEMVPRVREIERAYDYARGAAEAAPPVRVFAALAFAPQGAAPAWITVDGGSYGHDVLRVCGGANTAAAQTEDAGTAVLTLADIVAAQPEVILLPETPDQRGPLALEDWAALDIPAARHGHIYPIDPDLLTWYGTRVAFALRDLPPLVMGGHSLDADPAY